MSVVERRRLNCSTAPTDTPSSRYSRHPTVAAIKPLAVGGDPDWYNDGRAAIISGLAPGTSSDDEAAEVAQLYWLLNWTTLTSTLLVDPRSGAGLIAAPIPN